MGMNKIQACVVGGWIVLMVCFVYFAATAPVPMKTTKTSEKYQLKQLSLGGKQSSSGGFFVIAGTGGGGMSSGENYYYTFYRSTDSGGYQLEKVKVENDMEGNSCVVIYEDAAIPYVRKTPGGYICLGYWELHIPKDSIKYEIEVNIPTN